MSLDESQLGQLDAFGRGVAARLGKVLPAALEGAWLETEEGDEEPFLVVQWSAPDDAGCDLELSTYGGEVTLSTRFWHEHSSLLEAAPGEDEIDAALALLGRLLGGSARPTAIFRDGEWLRSMLIESDAELELLCSELGPADWMWVRSHDGRGTLETGPGSKPDDL